MIEIVDIRYCRLGTASLSDARPDAMAHAHSPGGRTVEAADQSFRMWGARADIAEFRSS